MYKYLLFALSGLMLSGCAAHTATSGRVEIKDDSAATAGRVAVKDNGAATVVRFSAGDRAVIENYYREIRPRKNIPGIDAPAQGRMAAYRHRGGTPANRVGAEVVAITVIS